MDFPKDLTDTIDSLKKALSEEPQKRIVKPRLNPEYAPSIAELCRRVGVYRSSYYEAFERSEAPKKEPEGYPVDLWREWFGKD